MFEADAEGIRRLGELVRRCHGSGRPLSLLDITPGRGQLAWSLWRPLRQDGLVDRVQMMAQVGGPVHAELLATAERARAHLGPTDGTAPAPLLVNDPRRPRGTKGLLGHYDFIALSALRGHEALLPVLRAICWHWLLLLSARPDWRAGEEAGLERVHLLRVDGMEGGRAHTAYFSIWRRVDVDAPAPAPASTAELAGADAALLGLDALAFFQGRLGLDGHAAYADYAPGRMVRTGRIFAGQ